MHRSLLYLLSSLLLGTVARADRPNVLWITCEDAGPHLGCYGDPDADTPTLDALARRSLVYERCWSNAPVCAPARTTILTGRYPFRLGAASMRTSVPLPPTMQVLPELMRAAGYYCTNRAKTDYNVELGRDVWDESSGKAHWRKRAEGQPFFSVVNLTVSHESQIRKRPHTPVHDPATVRVPAYHPDHPVVRRDWAQYHDKVTEMDGQVARWLAQLEEDGLADDTIVFFYGDHGSGMSRNKRWPYASGLRVPMILHVPERFAHLAPEHDPGAHTDERIAFVDLMPTVLALAGIDPPDDMDGRAFLGESPGPEPEVLVGFRDRMDERIDLVRSLCDGDFLYVRNYHPHRRYGEFLDYMFQTPSTRVWRDLYDAGELNAAQSTFWETKAAEELYDLRADPDEVLNLAVDPDQAERLEWFRSALARQREQTIDRSFLPEHDLFERAGSGPPARVVAPFATIYAAADAASDTSQPLEPGWFVHADPAVRAWVATGLLLRGEDAVRQRSAWLLDRLEDSSWSVRVAAAEALARHAPLLEREVALQVLVAAANLRDHDLRLVVASLNALDALDYLAWPVRAQLTELPRESDQITHRMRNYAPRLLDRIGEELSYETRVYRTVEGVDLELMLFAPVGPVPDGGRPAVVFFHGGGWNSGSPDQFFDQAAQLAARGMVTASVRYRLGQDGFIPPQLVADAKAAVRWMRAHSEELGVDPERVAAAGGSAGGHLAAATAFLEGHDDAPEGVSCRPDALLLFNPVIDNGPGGWGHARVEAYWQDISPLHNLRAPAPPTLFLLGTADSAVPVSTGEAFKAAIEEVGGRCDLRLAEGAVHGWFNRGRGGYAETTGQVEDFLCSLGWIE